MKSLSQSEIKSILNTALKAGEIAMLYFGDQNLKITTKIDHSPLTEADSLISQLINNDLKKLFPNIPVICEEGKNRDFGDGIFWLIDPIDGTNSFAEHNPEFTINIALIKNKIPIFGLIYAPAITNKPLYYVDENHHLAKYIDNNRSEVIDITQPKNSKNFTVISSKRSQDWDILGYLNDNFTDKILDKKVIINKVSSSLKFCYFLDGKADLYLHLRPSMEWDIGAGHALLLAAGFKLVNLDGSEFLYQKNDLTNKPFLVMVNC